MPKQIHKADAEMSDKSRHQRLYFRFHLVLIFAVTLLSVGILFAAAPRGHNPINNERNAVFAQAWQCSVNDEPLHAVTLPDSKHVAAGSRLILKNQIPLDLIRGATVLLRTSQQDVAVYVDGLNIYSSYDIGRGVATPTSAYHFVRLPVDCAGKGISVVLSSPLEDYAGYMNQIYIGSKSANIFFLLQQHGFRFMAGFLIFCAGFLLMILFFFADRKGNNATFIYLGSFFVSAGYWMLVESRITQFILPYPVWLTNSSIFALSLMPVFSGLYYFSTHGKLFQRPGKYVIAIMSAASFSLAITACVNPMLPLRILPYYLIFMGLYVVVLFVPIIVEAVKSQRLFSASIWGILMLGVCALLELAMYLSNVKGYSSSAFLDIGLLLLCGAMVVDSAQNFTRVYQAAIKVDALSVLAYADALTGLKNRAAFLEKMSELQAHADDTVSLAMFDINNLKLVNDTLGHLVGDAMLRHSAKVIKSSLPPAGTVYRIGGDEFVAVLCHKKGFDTNCVEQRMRTMLHNENQKASSYLLSIASGYATFSAATDKTLFETLARADAKMYACKRAQKETEAPASVSDCENTRATNG